MKPLAIKRGDDLVSSPLDTLVFHDNDPDGWAAAWSIRKVLPDATFISLNHGTLNYAEIILSKAVQLEDIIPRETNLIITDLSFDREQTLMLENIYFSVTVIDHHFSTEKSIGDLDYVFTNMSKSAAILAWEFFHNSPPTTMLEYIQDYDIWTKELLYTEEINLVIQSYPLDFDRLDKLDFQLEHLETLDDVVNAGSAMKRFRDNQVKIIVNNSHMAKFVDQGLGLKFTCVNSPVFISEVGHIISEGQQFAAIWQQLPNGDYKYSLRSRDSMLNVSIIAKAFGGGGHARAASFITKEKVHEITR